MSKSYTIIKIDEIRSLYREYCEKEGRDFNENDFIEFLKFLEVDFYDWARENLRQYLFNNEFVKLK